MTHEVLLEGFERELLGRLREYSPWTYDHSERVAKICAELGLFVGFSSEEITLLKRAGWLHDIGKLTITKDILDASSIDEDAMELLDKHPRIGFEMLKDYDFELATIVVAHHEFQERRYPRMASRGERNTKTALLQEVLALADVVDALLSRRPYKSPWSRGEAFQFLKGRFDSNKVSFAIDARLNIQRDF